MRNEWTLLHDFGYLLVSKCSDPVITYESVLFYLDHRLERLPFLVYLLWDYRPNKWTYSYLCHQTIITEPIDNNTLWEMKVLGLFLGRTVFQKMSLHVGYWILCMSYLRAILLWALAWLCWGYQPRLSTNYMISCAFYVTITVWLYIESETKCY